MRARKRIVVTPCAVNWNKDIVAIVGRSAQLRLHLFAQQFYQRGITVWLHDVIADRSLDKGVKRGSRFASVDDFENTRALAQRQAQDCAVYSCLLCPLPLACQKSLPHVLMPFGSTIQHSLRCCHAS